MKKNLRNLLVLTLGLMTTIVTAQDWSIDSRTRVNNLDNDMQTNTDVDQRVTLGTTWGGSGWGINASTDLGYTLGNGNTVSNTIYEAYVSCDLMGFATMTAGRQDLSFGSGTLISSNSWGMDRYTNDGMSFTVNNNMLDVSAGTLNGLNRENYYVNAGKSGDNWSANFLMVMDGDDRATALDVSYSMAGATLSFNRTDDGNDATYTNIGLSYGVMDNLTISAGRTTNEGGFTASGTALSGGWDNGNIGYLTDGDTDTYLGFAYDLGGISLGYTFHRVANDNAADDADSSELHLGYSLNDNCAISMSRMGGADAERNYLTISITP